MIIFDWRRFERDRERRDHWPRYEEVDLLNRYPAGTIGRDAWRKFISNLPGEDFAPPAAAHEALDQFYHDTADLPRPPQPCVFISHQRADTHLGERVACLVDHFNLNGWLDVHDPTLIAVNRMPSNDPRRSVLIAVIVEIALLNSTHIIALHTKNSLASRWVPYEFARAKSHKILSAQAAGWFELGQSPATCGDYVQLAVMTHDEPHVLHWLGTVPRASPTVVPATCRQHGTSTLL